MSCSANIQNGDSTSDTNISQKDVAFEEIKIPVPWGHISGKWWGSRTSQPYLAIHGWQDNAGTFDQLAPLLAQRGHSILCIDLPGHGLSSHYAEGHFYYIFWDGIHIVRRIVKFFNWRAVTIVGHSLGGIIAFLYAAVYPDDVKKIVQFDIAGPPVRNPTKVINTIGGAVDKFLKYETLTDDQKPCYTFDEMIDIVQEAYAGSLTLHSCKIMMRRGMIPSEHDKNKFLFTRDPRLKVSALGLINAENTLEWAGHVKCEVLNIRGNPGFKLEYPEHYDLVLDGMEKQAKRVERHVIEGTHHLHLNDAEKVVDVVHDFLVS